MCPWRFEQEQALVQEQLARLAQREKERDSAAAAGGGLAKVPSSLIMEQGKVHEEQEKAKILVSHSGTSCCSARLH